MILMVYSKTAASFFEGKKYYFSSLRYGTREFETKSHLMIWMTLNGFRIGPIKKFNVFFNERDINEGLYTSFSVME